MWVPAERGSNSQHLACQKSHWNFSYMPWRLLMPGLSLHLWRHSRSWRRRLRWRLPTRWKGRIRRGPTLSIRLIRSSHLFPPQPCKLSKHSCCTLRGEVMWGSWTDRWTSTPMKSSCVVAGYPSWWRLRYPTLLSSPHLLRISWIWRIRIDFGSYVFEKTYYAG